MPLPVARAGVAALTVVVVAGSLGGTATPAVADPPGADGGQVGLRVAVPDRVVGQQVVVRYDVVRDDHDGDVRVVLRSPQGYVLDSWREPSYPADGRIRLRLARTSQPGRYGVEVRWRGQQGTGAVTRGVFFRVARQP